MSTSPPSRNNWFVSLTVGIVRGLGSLFTAIAARLEANPGDVRPSLVLWAFVIVLGVAIATLTGRSSLMPMPIPQVAPTEPPDAAIAVTDTTTVAATETPSEPKALEPEFEPIASSSAATEPAIAPEVAPEVKPEVDPEELDSFDFPEPEREESPDAIEPKLPQELVAPDAATPLTPAPTPLTPEQQLIAALQERIAAVSEEYAGDAVIAAVRIDFGRNRLEVGLTDDWYGLDPGAQDRLATDLRDRGRTFDFYDIELVDSAGQVVARPAVVGDATIVIRRSR